MEKKYPLGHKRVLILYNPLGEGHAIAAKALAEVFALKYPEIEVRNIDVFSFLFEIVGKTIRRSYNYVTTNMPFLYKWIYDFNNNRIRSNILNHTSNIISQKSNFVKFIQEYNPDFIISTNPLPLQLVSKTKEQKIIDIPSANVCTDFGFHSLWYNKDVNYYFVANEEIKKFLCEHGVSPESIKITGIPVSSKISKNLKKSEIINKLGFNNKNPILLIVGGRMKYNKLLKIVNGITRLNNSIQIVIVAGRDEFLFKKIQESNFKKNKQIRIFGFIDNLDEYMSASDLILTKAGGLTMAECLVKNLPMVISDIIPGQEEDNVEYAIRQGFAIEERATEKLIGEIVKLLNDKERLLKMKEACKGLAKPNSANEIADFVVSTIK